MSKEWFEYGGAQPVAIWEPMKAASLLDSYRDASDHGHDFPDQYLSYPRLDPAWKRGVGWTFDYDRYRENPGGSINFDRLNTGSSATGLTYNMLTTTLMVRFSGLVKNQWNQAQLCGYYSPRFYLWAIYGSTNNRFGLNNGASTGSAFTEGTMGLSPPYGIRNGAAVATLSPYSYTFYHFCVGANYWQSNSASSLNGNIQLIGMWTHVADVMELHEAMMDVPTEYAAVQSPAAGNMGPAESRSPSAG